MWLLAAISGVVVGFVVPYIQHRWLPQPARPQIPGEIRLEFTKGHRHGLALAMIACALFLLWFLGAISGELWKYPQWLATSILFTCFTLIGTAGFAEFAFRKEP